MYVETKVRGKKLQAMVDMGADTIYMAKELTIEIILPYKRRRAISKK